MGVAAARPEASASLQEDTVLHTASQPEFSFLSLQENEGPLFRRALRRLQPLREMRPSPMRGLLIGLFLSGLLWAAIVGFVLTF